MGLLLLWLFTGQHAPADHHEPARGGLSTSAVRRPRSSSANLAWRELLAALGAPQELGTLPGGTAGRTRETRGLAFPRDLIDLRRVARCVRAPHTSGV